ncbi:MAG: hypothetical protein ACPLSP_02635, partial [Fervidicoccus fontis]
LNLLPCLSLTKVFLTLFIFSLKSADDTPFVIIPSRLYIKFARLTYIISYELVTLGTAVAFNGL